MNLKDLKRKIFENGIVGAGGAGFPTDKKLTDKAEVIILNCAECEPLFRVDRQLMEEYCYNILEALSLIVEASGAKKGVVAVKSSYKSAIKSVQLSITKYTNLELKILPDVYPAGDEVILVYEVTGKIVPEGSIPLAVGAAVFNVETMLNIHKAVFQNQPVTEKYVTVSGDVRNPVTLKVPVGISIKELIELAGGTELEDFEIIIGGPMTGRLADLNSVVTKTTKGVLVFPKEHLLITQKHLNPRVNLNRIKSVCSQCQMCTDLCPRHLLGHAIRPNRVMNALGNELLFDTKDYTNTFLCSGCGVCEMYACHQGLSPRTLILDVKSRLSKNGVKNTHNNVPECANAMREYRLVPEHRIVERLSIKKYDVKAPLKREIITSARIGLKLNQHIGAPAVPIVKAGDKVTKNQLVADITDDKLGAKIHASINGVVVEINKDTIIIMESRGELNE